ncbi:ROK family protein [Streptomyces cellostaticus]|uniref:ROK family protein n=1 Tax=Streptomyces cellostaticus TaxID=67285 RepID=UPI00202687F6|nr:ROK family protein [Streptomyces cellostaticus]
MELRTLGVDIGGTTWSVGRWDGDALQVIATGVTGEHAPEEVRGLRSAIAQATVLGEPVDTVGVAFPGAVAKDGRVTDWPNRPRWVGAHLASALGIGRDVRLEVTDDGVAALRGETALGVGRGLSDVLLLTLGTGIGGGLLLDGRVRAPLPHDARTIGHLRALPPDGVSHTRCSCDRTGCLQTALASLPDERVLREQGLAAWPAGERLLDFLADLTRILAVPWLVLTGGLLCRDALREALTSGAADRGLTMRVPARPEQSTLLGALAAGGWQHD